MPPVIRLKTKSGLVEGLAVSYSRGRLPFIRLVNGYRFACQCISSAADVEMAEGLDQSIALHLIDRDAPLRPAEVRFLRRLLSLTQDELAHILGVSRQTVIRYESSRTAFNKSCDIVLRLTLAWRFLPREQREQFVPRLLTLNFQGSTGSDVVYFAFTPDGWQTGEVASANA